MLCIKGMGQYMCSLHLFFKSKKKRIGVDEMIIQKPQEKSVFGKKKNQIKVLVSHVCALSQTL
jgi:hypothetical protein